MEIKVAFNFIYTMDCNGLMIFLTFLQLSHGTWVESSTFNMLKPLFRSCILHLPLFNKTHVIFFNPTFIFEWISDFFHISSIINMCTWVEPFTFNSYVKSIIHKLHFSFIIILKKTCNLIFCKYIWMV
jgi:hypothetical protein